MIKGIKVNGMHTYYKFGLRMLKRSIGPAVRDDHTERVPYSDVVYDFDELFRRSYSERNLSYTFEFMEYDVDCGADRLVNVLNSMHWEGYSELYDDMMPGYHFEAKEPEITFSENHGKYTFEMNFKAKPAIKFNPEKLKNTLINTILPDIDGDGKVDSTDASKIMEAYSRLSTGKDSGLDPHQEAAADADKDTKISATDASLVLSFYTAVSTGKYKDMTLEKAWVSFLNDFTGTETEVY